jgi:Tc toxin complex TcA C-terminal TcB-binding domain
MNNKKELIESLLFSGAFEKFFGKQQIYLQFSPFFHAHVSEFIKQLNRDGISGLLNLANQTLGNPYLHSPWKSGYTISQASNAPACIIESGFGKTNTRPGNFEAVVREGSDLVHYWHDSSNVSSNWQRARVITSSATGAGCIIQREFSPTLDAQGIPSVTLDVVVLVGGELHHYTNNDTSADQPWIFQGVIPHGANSPGCLIESDFLNEFRRSLEVVVLQTSGLVHYRKQNNTGVWMEQGVISNQATGAGCIIQSSFQSGDRGNFEVVVLENNKLVHYSKDHTKNGWDRGAVITDRATSAGWIIQSRIRDGQHGNFEVVVCEGKQLVHYWKDNSDRSSPWRRGQVITNKATGAGCIMHGSFNAIGNFEVVVPEENGKLAHYWNVNEGDIGSEGERFYFDRTYKPTQYVDAPYPRHDVDFSYGGAYSLYNWELFFHAPMILASRLSQNQRFAEAMRWYHYIFDPTDNSNELTTHRFWKVLPFRDVEKLRIDHMLAILADPAKKGTPERQKIVDQIDDSIKNPFQPHRIARLRLIAYQKNVLMKYIDNLVAWGDQLFRRDTIESINEATQLYILAASLLGPRPQKIPKRGKVKAKTYAELRKQGLNELQIVKDEVENEFPNASAYTSVGTSSETAALLGIGDTFYFCIPQNDKLMGYWDTVEDRLFKIRHCMNIEGVERQLPLFEPPIDPALLVQAAAKGVDLSSVLSDLSAPLPHYRFSYMLQKALEVCADLKSLGAALLSALEKRDAEELAAVRAKHETEILKLVRLVKEKQHEEAIAAKEALSASRQISITRYVHYQNLLGDENPQKPELNAPIPEKSPTGVAKLKSVEGVKMTLYEEEALALSNFAAENQSTAGIIEAFSSSMNLIPGFGVSFQPFGTGGTMSFGGSNLAGYGSSFARVFQWASQRLAHLSSQANQVASSVIREQDWVLQYNLAAKEIMQIDKQLLASDIRIAIAEQELKNHDKQIENAQLIEEFFHSKYTNEELYRWMQGEISTIFFQSYQLAYDLAKKAERCYRFERGITSSNFIQFGYWDSLRKGLMSGERLYLALKQLERAYHDQNKRDYEITKNISLMLNDPLALITLKETGTCTIELPEALFDADYPGHYMRRIKSVSLTIPCVVGPYTSINCTLTLLTNKTRINSLAQSGYPEDLENEDSRFVTNFAAMQSIATSTAQNDSGLFELNFRDERYLPFEGAGVISRWRIELPTEFRQFDYNTITDVILHLRYTARDGGTLLKNAAVAHLRDYFSQDGATPSLRMFDLRQEFPTQWHRFLNPTNPEDGNVFELEMSPSLFPIRDKDKTLKVNTIWLLARCSDAGDYTVVMTLPDESTIEMTLPPVNQYGGLHFMQTGVEIDLVPTDLPVKWQFKMTRPGGGNLQEDPLKKVMEVEELLLVLGYEWEPSGGGV